MKFREVPKRVKEHVKEHKEAYVAGTACLVAGAVAGLVARVQLIQVVDAMNVKYKSPTSTQIINMLDRRGHPGYVVQNKETGQPFQSLNQACEMDGINRGDLYRHLKGELPHVKGHTYEVLGEATPKAA